MTLAAGVKPVSLMASTKYVRAAHGGTGSYKLGSKLALWVTDSSSWADYWFSYAQGIVPQIEAAKDGYGQILWLLGDNHTLTEVSFRL